MSYQDQLKDAETIATVTPQSMVMNQVGDKFRGMYLGLTQFEKTDTRSGELKLMQVANFFNGIGVYFNMGAQLTRAIQAIRPGTSVELTLIELKPNKGQDGKTKIYSIAPLAVEWIDPAVMFGGALALAAPAEANGGRPAQATYAGDLAGLDDANPFDDEEIPISKKTDSPAYCQKHLTDMTGRTSDGLPFHLVNGLMCGGHGEVNTDDPDVCITHLYRMTATTGKGVIVHKVVNQDGEFYCNGKEMRPAVKK